MLDETLCRSTLRYSSPAPAPIPLARSRSEIRQLRALRNVVGNVSPVTARELGASGLSHQANVRATDAAAVGRVAAMVTAAAAAAGDDGTDGDVAGVVAGAGATSLKDAGDAARPDADLGGSAAGEAAPQPATTADPRAMAQPRSTSRPQDPLHMTARTPKKPLAFGGQVAAASAQALHRPKMATWPTSTTNPRSACSCATSGPTVSGGTSSTWSQDRQTRWTCSSPVTA